MKRLSFFQCAAWVAVANVIVAPQLAAAEPVAQTTRMQAVAQALRPVDIELDRQGAITGQVVDLHGQPVVGVRVTMDNGREQIQLATDARGGFRASGLRGKPQKRHKRFRRVWYRRGESSPSPGRFEWRSFL